MPTAFDGALAQETVGTVEPVAPEKPLEKPEETPIVAKKPEELYAETKALIDAQAKELKKLQETIGVYDEDRKRREAEDRLRYITQPETPEPVGKVETPPPGPEDFDWGNPLKSIESRARKIALEEMGKKEKTNAEYQKKMDGQRAAQNFFATKDRVFKKNPELFTGYEDELSRTMTIGYQTGALTADMIGNDETWETGALMLAKKQGDRKKIEAYFKIAPIEAMKDTGSGAIPGQVKEAKSTKTIDVDFDDEAIREYMKQRGITREQAIELIKYARDNSYVISSRETIGSR